ncbi:MAG: DUF1080 domain-containing protein [Niabella sp.]
MFKKTVVAIILIAVSATFYSFYKQRDNTLTKAEKKAGWVLLFDGKTLNGWRIYQNKPADCWAARNGEIYCKGSKTDKSDLRADLISKDQYENFELLIDWKIAPAGNSGIMYNVTEEGKAAFETGPEFQLIDDEGFPAKLHDWQKTGADYAMYPPLAKAAKAPGEWNTARIIVKGAHREYWLNGIQTADFEAWTPDWNQRKANGKWKDTPGYGMAKKGHIVLQDHGSGVWFKNIKMRRL